ncbi:MAG: hypothetical protein HYT40_03090, partial [Candidatus Sungbacteria bacterium]|nr:hypothetical protein [Candidatus Sungbacteria bacterium]
KSGTIKQLVAGIGTADKELAAAVRELASRSEDNLLEVMLQNDNLSDFFGALNSLESLQKRIHEVLDNLRGQKAELERQRAELEDFQEDQQQIKSLQEIERRENRHHRGRRIKVYQTRV